jgi:hypothetical protein
MRFLNACRMREAFEHTQELAAFGNLVMVQLDGSDGAQLEACLRMQHRCALLHHGS